MLKTYENWNCDLHEYLEVGDTVDDELAVYIRDTLPPIMFGNVIQMGEPYEHINGKPTYLTIEEVEGEWIYRGKCYEGEITEPVHK